MFVGGKAQQSVKSLCHPPAVPLGTVQLQKCQMELLCFVIFPFLSATIQPWLSDTEHFFCCCGFPSCSIFYAIPFLENPRWRRAASRALRPPRRHAAEARVLAPGVPLFSLRCLSPFSCSPLGL